jgi:hypothetical protein
MEVVVLSKKVIGRLAEILVFNERIRSCVGRLLSSKRTFHDGGTG